jgi:hypothetical protein
MRRHADAAGVQEHGCLALLYLAMNAGSKPDIIRAGGRDVVLAAKRRYGRAIADAVLEELQ